MLLPLFGFFYSLENYVLPDWIYKVKARPCGLGGNGTRIMSKMS